MERNMLRWRTIRVVVIVVLALGLLFSIYGFMTNDHVVVFSESEKKAWLSAMGMGVCAGVLASLALEFARERKIARRKDSGDRP
ncbi:MAG: hypothetical protein ACYC3H_04255 [Bellilinea sp.]